MNQPNEGMRERFDEKFGNYHREVAIEMTQEEKYSGRPQLFTDITTVTKDFIQSEIDLALAKQRSEIMNKVQEIAEANRVNGFEAAAQNIIRQYEDIISTITKDTKD